jgi:hemolysin III
MNIVNKINLDALKNGTDPETTPMAEADDVVEVIESGTNVGGITIPGLAETSSAAEEKPTKPAEKKGCRRKKINEHMSRGEEVFNGVSHAVGIGIGISALVLGIVFGAVYNTGPDRTAAVLSMIVFGIGIIVLYSMSSIYHFMHECKGKRVLCIMDHCCIYVLIAATYTPYCVALLRHLPAGWIMFGLVWGVGAIGVALNAWNMDNKGVRIFSLISYIGLGWLAMFSVGHLLNYMNILGFILLVVGGVVYTVGAIFYVISLRKKWFHAVWHLFVLAGTLFHFMSILFFVIIF